MAYNLYVISADFLDSLLCCAIVLLLALQPKRDRKSQVFLAFAIVEGLNALSFVLARLFGLIRPELFVPFFYVGFLIYTVYPGVLLRFASEFFELWTPFKRQLARWLLLLPVVATLGAVTNNLFYSVTLLPSGSFHYPPTPLTIGLFVIGELGLFYTLYLVARHALSVKWQARRQLVFGVMLLLWTLLLVPFENLFRVYGALGLFVSTVFIMGSALRHRLFDPMMRMNRKLMRRTSKLRKAMQRNEILLQQVQQANEAKTRFIGYISHEVRNPISNIFTTVQTMVEHEYLFKEPLPAEYRTELARISRQAEHLRQLINDLLDIGQIEAGAIQLAREPLDLVPILQEVQQTISAQLQPGVVVQPCYADSLPPVNADPMRLRQILMNLLSNAAKFTEQGTITLSAVVEPSMLRVDVTDTGRGMPEAVMIRLFQPYTQDVRDVQQARRGTGLGLTITKSLVELHGGTIQVHSKVGEGTTVSFSIPLANSGRLTTETGE